MGKMFWVNECRCRFVGVPARLLTMWYPMHSIAPASQSAMMIIQPIILNHASLSLSLSLSLFLFFSPFVRSEVLNFFSASSDSLCTLLCLLSSSSLPPLLPSSRLSYHCPPISAWASLVFSCPPSATLSLSSVVCHPPSFHNVPIRLKV